MEQSLENANKLNSKLSLENEYNIKPIIEQIIAKGIKEWHPKHPLNSTLVPNNVNPIINQKNKFDFNSVRSFGLQKIVQKNKFDLYNSGFSNLPKIIQHKSTNQTNSNINYIKLHINTDPFFPKNIIKKDFNDFVAKTIKNHEFVVDDKNYVFDESGEELAESQVLKKLWEKIMNLF